MPHHSSHTPIFDVEITRGKIDVAGTHVPGPSAAINVAVGQADPATGTPILFTATFSEPVTGFVTGDVTLSGTAGATTATVIDSGDHMTFSVEVTGMTGPGTVIVAIPGGVATSIATAAANTESSIPNPQVTISPLTVTATLAVGQNVYAGGALGAPVRFAAVFSEPVTGFTDPDVTLTGTSGATTVNVTNSGDDIHFTIEVSGMSVHDGDVTISIDAAVCVSQSFGFDNEASGNPQAYWIEWLTYNTWNFSGADMLVDGDTLYANPGTFPPFQIIDISTIDNWALVGSLNHSSLQYLGVFAGRQIVKDGDNVYIAVGTGSSSSGRMAIVDVITTPSAPSPVGSVASSAISQAGWIGKSGNYVFVPDRFVGGGMTSIDVSTPATPTVADSLYHTDLALCQAVAIDGNYLYTTGSPSAGTFVVIDISNPTALAYVATVNLAFGHSTITDRIIVDSGFAYYVSNGYLTIIDVSTPTSPTVVSETNLTTAVVGTHLAKSGNFLYVTGTSADSFTEIDVSNPASPSVARTFTTATSVLDTAREVVISGTNALVDTLLGVAVIDIS